MQDFDCIPKILPKKSLQSTWVCGFGFLFTFIYLVCNEGGRDAYGKVRGQLAEVISFHCGFLDLNSYPYLSSRCLNPQSHLASPCRVFLQCQIYVLSAKGLLFLIFNY